MTDARFLVHGDFAECAAKLVRLEIRIVAESTASARRKRNAPPNLAAFDELLSVVVICRGANVSRAPVGASLELPDEELVVRVVERLSIQIGTGAPSLAAYAGRAAERVDFEPGIIGDGRKAGPTMKVARLVERVLLESLRAFEPILL